MGCALGATWRRACFGLEADPEILQVKNNRVSISILTKVLPLIGEPWSRTFLLPAVLSCGVLFGARLFAQPGQLVRRISSEATRYARHNRRFDSWAVRGEDSGYHQSGGRKARLKSRGRSWSHSILPSSPSHHHQGNSQGFPASFDQLGPPRYLISLACLSQPKQSQARTCAIDAPHGLIQPVQTQPNSRENLHRRISHRSWENGRRERKRFVENGRHWW